MVISDNGASAEGGPHGSVNENKFFNNVPDELEENLPMIDQLGGPKTFNHYPWGWTFAGNTPFRRWKRETYRGGISDPFIVHWPKGIKAKGEVRTQYAHADRHGADRARGARHRGADAIKGVTQSPIEGLSFAHAFDDAKAPSKHVTQYFEMFGHRSIYHDGWRAVCPWPGTSFTEAGVFFGAPIDKNKLTELDAKGWELYHVEEDFAENHNLAAENRPKLIEMIAMWYVEAGKYNVLPIDSRGTLRFADPRPQIAADRKSYIYYPGTQMVPINAGPTVLNRPHSLTADVEIPEGWRGGRAVLGGRRPGRLLVLRAGRQAALRLQLRRQPVLPRRVERAGPGGTAHAALRVRGHRQARHQERQGRAGPGQLYIDGKLVGQVDIPLTMPLSLGLGGGFVCGADTGSPVWDKYKPPFKFTGTLYSVTVDVSGELIKDSEAEMRIAMAQQ